jgi:hypothetical protein
MNLILDRTVAVCLYIARWACCVCFLHLYQYSVQTTCKHCHLVAASYWLGVSCLIPKEVAFYASHCDDNCKRTDSAVTPGSRRTVIARVSGLVTMTR